MNKVYFMVACFMCLILASCQQREELQEIQVNNKSQVDDSIMENIKFVPITQRLQNVSNRAIAATNHTYLKAPSKGNISIIILQFDDWGRTSRNCHGFGLCHVVWFPVTSVSDKYLEELGSGASILELDDINRQYYIDLLLAESAPIKNGELLPTLKIDENLELTKNEELLKSLSVKKGEYSYNPQLGEYGGYRITVVE